MHLIRTLLVLTLLTLLGGCAGIPAPPQAVPPPTAQPDVPKPPDTPKPPAATRAVRIGLALGGGAARGFAHIGVIKALEAQGIKPDMVVGTSAGAVVGALYASGMNGFQLQQVAMEISEKEFTDWTLPRRGVLKGEALQEFINKRVEGRPLEALAVPLGIVATDLKNGDRVVFRTGNTGMAVRASSTVPGIFQPMVINGREYVDGGLSSPVPVQAARDMGADFVIAVDIGNKPRWGSTESTLDVLLQTFTIMGSRISLHEMAAADVVIRPDTGDVSSTDFAGRHQAILEGEKAAALAMATLKTRLAKARGR